MLRNQVIELRKALVTDEGALHELAQSAGRSAIAPNTPQTQRRNEREVSYKPGRRGAVPAVSFKARIVPGIKRGRKSL